MNIQFKQPMQALAFHTPTLKGVLPTKRRYYTLSKFQSKKPNSSALRNQLLNFAC